MPSDRDVDSFVEAVADSGVQLVGLNFFAGELTGPDCGVLSIPARSSEFTDNLDVAVGIGERLGVSAFNALYGNRVDSASPEEQDQLGLQNLVARPPPPTGSAPPSWSSPSAAPSRTPFAPPPTWPGW